MNWTDAIYNAIWGLGSWLRTLAVEAGDIWIVGNILRVVIDSIADIVIGIRQPVFDALVWALDASNSIKGILAPTDIYNLLSDWIEKVGSLWSWFTDISSRLSTLLADWWQVALAEVSELIKAASEAPLEALRALQERFTTLEGNWYSFKAVTLPTLTTEALVTSLIDSKLLEWFPFYNDLAVIVSSLRDFAANPLGWLYSQLEEFFERYW